MAELARSHSPIPSTSRYPSPWPSPNQSRPASDSPSPSASFRGDRTLLLTRKHGTPFVLVSGRPCCGHNLLARASSLDDIRKFRKSTTGTGSKHQRSASARSSRRRKSSVFSDGRKNSRRASTSIDRSRAGSAKSRRASTIQSPVTTIPSGVQSAQSAFDGDIIDKEEYLKKHRRHRIAFWMVLGSFIFIAISSILVVVVTLTHQSEYNTTVTYYTFAKPSSMIIEENLRSQGE